MADTGAASAPRSLKSPVCVTVSALDAGHLTLPEHLFITDADPSKRTTVPSLSFLIQHPSPRRPDRTTTKLLFDLGLKRDLSGYRTLQQQHIAQRQPISTSPDAAASLRAGGLDPADIDLVMLSHVHWDHVGTPADFSTATFVVGAGTLRVLRDGDGPNYPRELFNADELPADRTVELPPVRADAEEGAQVRRTEHVWAPFAGFPAAVDFFGDGSVWVIDAPGHLTGHVNLLTRVGPGRWVYLGGDCCHDVRILAGEKSIAEYEDGRGGIRSVHADTGAARGTVERIKSFLEAGKVEGERKEEVEIVVAHDGSWREMNMERFWPGQL
ncbi:hypothetical protein AOQ84DRAFT_298755 [Glonium stellatum]|uniref:Metallo-beta-lactamase domain-containing protein n=1 Tax=Glonium stellatum TaxID=574774 RepID=A0A8E2JQD0_9PEZI|nr:hypothetical protein AOQ84DRAFT_298755 [Glonium stellatum]